MKYSLFGLLFFLVSINLNAQEVDNNAEEEEEDYSQYENMSALPSDYKIKTYATQKVLGQSPTKLVYVGYEIVAPHTFTADALNTTDFGLPELSAYEAQQNNIQLSHGIRGETNVPIISRNNIILNFTGTYIEQRYRFENAVGDASNPLLKTLQDASIRSLGAGLTLFKPFDAKNFMILQVQGDYAGTWNIVNWHNPKHIKISAAAMYGRKPTERLMWGVGFARTYRVGEQNYIPIAMFNYTAVSQKWGIEMLLPARADFRYSVNPRNLLKIGGELEGMSYYLTSKNNFYNSSAAQLQDVELKRGELRMRIVYERPIYKFLWFTAQAGYRVNWDYNVDDGDFFRGFSGTQPFLQQNNLGNAFYFSTGIMLVSP